MPRGDRTGPAGLGPMTGRAAGYCAGYGVPGYANPVGGAGLGRAWGRGGGGGRGMAWHRGWGGWAAPAAYAAPPPVAYGWPVAPVAAPAYSAATERAVLEQQVNALQGQLKALQDRLEALGEEQEESGEK